VTRVRLTGAKEREPPPFISASATASSVPLSYVLPSLAFSVYPARLLCVLTSLRLRDLQSAICKDPRDAPRAPAALFAGSLAGCCLSMRARRPRTAEDGGGRLDAARERALRGRQERGKEDGENGNEMKERETMAPCGMQPRPGHCDLDCELARVALHIPSLLESCFIKNRVMYRNWIYLTCWSNLRSLGLRTQRVRCQVL
jgi:hypothetical protein